MVFSLAESARLLILPLTLPLSPSPTPPFPPDLDSSELGPLGDSNDDAAGSGKIFPFPTLVAPKTRYHGAFNAKGDSVHLSLVKLIPNPLPIFRDSTATLSDGSIHGVQNGKIQKRSGLNKVKNKNKRVR